MMDYLCGELGDFIVSAVLIVSLRQSQRHTDRQTDTHKRLTHVSE